MPLTATAIRAAKPKERPQKLFDGGGLYLLINPNGARYWRLKYRHSGRERLLSIGVYPEVSLAEARRRRDDARGLLRDGIDPSAARQAERATRIDREEGSFELVAREWFAKQKPKWAESHSSKVLGRLEKHMLPYVGDRPIREITGPELLEVLRRAEESGADTAQRVRQYFGAIFRYAIATHRADADPSAVLKGAIEATKVKHHASITDPKRVGDLLRAIDGYYGSEIVRHALKFAPLVFVRPGELRQAQWSEFTFDLVPPARKDRKERPPAEWRIPAERMKMRVQHIVPLSNQAVEILRSLHKHTGPDGFLFPSIRTKSRPMSENTINAALRKMDYSKDEMTGHGFRSMASTMLHEQGWRSEIIERQLAHADRDSVRAAYNYAEHLEERRHMMQAWADYLDRLTAAENVIALNSLRA